ncbi:MAG: transpeptidase family protein [Deltaproteobacteria bacterium]|nr:transpeptidase family protein [Deltaproteobacteria bacterium]
MNGRRPVRLAAACALIGGVLVGVAARLCQLALVDGERLAGLARRQHSETEQLTPLRGTILDRFGEPLALSIRADSVFVRPAQLPDESSGLAVARALEIPPKRWVKKISSPSPFTWIQRPASPDQLERLRRLNVPGVGTVPERRRFYPHGRMAAPVIGFAGVDSQGLEGIELTYDTYLRGAVAEMSVERDARGRRFVARGLESETPRQGANVLLTLDSSLQYVAERELDRRVSETRATGGLVLVLDPRNGEILALAQNPSFDPNRPLTADADRLRNRAVADAYEPGSTMKGLLAAAALEHRAVGIGDRFFCENGRYAFAGHTIHDHHGAGWLSFPEIFQVSSNIGATKVAERLGAGAYHQALRAFGLGSPTGVDLSGEQAGILRPLSAWKPIDLATASFGQGVAVTPMQLATAYAAIANGGILMRPFVVRRVVDENGETLVENHPTVVRRVLSEATAREVTAVLERVVGEKGTAPLAAVPGLRIAGKTGTAQKVDLVRGGYSRGRIASFVGYFPAEEPQVLMLVVIDDPRTTIWGGTAAAPLFRAVALAAAERVGVHREAAAAGPQPDPPPPAAGPVATGGAASRPTSFLGLSLREVLERARAEGLTVEVLGSGYVVRQDPPPGRSGDPDRTIRLQLEPTGEPVG